MAVLGNSSSNSANLIRGRVYSEYVQEALRAPLLSDMFVHDVSDFGDGTTLYIPTIGSVTVRDRVEGQSAQYEALEDGVFNLTISKYKEAANSITKDLLEDGFKGEYLMGRLANMQVQVMMEAYITNILAQESGQTADNANQINAVDHRFVAEASDDHISVDDIAYAGYALSMAKNPIEGRIGVVHPRVLLDIQRSANISNLINNPSFMGVVRDGMSKDSIMSLYDIEGFKILQSDMLASGKAETITHIDTSGTSNSDSITAGVANLFMSIADEDHKPIARAWRRMPEVENDYDMDTQQHKFLCTARWGAGLLRPDGLVVIIGAIS